MSNLDVSWGNNLEDRALLILARNMGPNTMISSLNLAGSGVGAIGVR